MTKQKSQKLFHKDFLLMVIGQIISLFGNTILRFALPLYLLNQTGSPALLGIVSAISFIPAILLSPVGGIIADRVNKRNIMVVLDFTTSGITLLFMLLLGQLSLVPLMVVTLMLLYGIQGAYSPAVQAVVPAMLTEDQFVPANSVINLVQSLAGLIGPVVGGLLYGLAGLQPVLILGVVCFFASAVMEIFIHIPHKKQQGNGGMLKTVKADLGVSVRFFREKPVIAKGTLIVAVFNIFLSSMLMVGMPVIITQVLPFTETFANQLYGYAQGIMAIGGLLGGVLAGVAGNKIRYDRMWLLLFGACLSIVPMALALLLGLPAMASYVIIALCSLLLMLFATMFTIQIISFVQLITPEALIGKVISVIMALCMCAQPIGQAMYGLLFDYFLSTSYIVLLFAAITSGIVVFFSRKVFARIGEALPEQNEEDKKPRAAKAKATA